MTQASYDQEVNNIYRLLNFIKWRSSPKPSNGLKICALSNNQALRKAILKLNERRTAWGPIHITLFDKQPDEERLTKQCHVLYIDQKQNYQKLINPLVHSNIVSISRTYGLPMKYCIFRFVEVNGRLKLRINRSLAQEKSIQISSSLLSIAAEVI